MRRCATTEGNRRCTTRVDTREGALITGGRDNERSIKLDDDALDDDNDASYLQVSYVQCGESCFIFIIIEREKSMHLVVDLIALWHRSNSEIQ